MNGSSRNTARCWYQSASTGTRQPWATGVLSYRYPDVFHHTPGLLNIPNRRIGSNRDQTPVLHTAESRRLTRRLPTPAYLTRARLHGPAWAWRCWRSAFVRRLASVASVAGRRLFTVAAWSTQIAAAKRRGTSGPPVPPLILNQATAQIGTFSAVHGRAPKIFWMTPNAR